MELQKEASKESGRKAERKPTFLGYFPPTNPLIISLIGIFGALTCVITLFLDIPIPATKGFLNIGDAAVMLTGLLFGPIIGGIAGGVGSSLADIILGYPIYAPATLIIKGLEGFVVGVIADPKKVHERISYRDIIAVASGGLLMVIGYFSYESMLYGPATALVEVPMNFIQYAAGIAISLLITLPIRKNLIQALPQVFDNVFIETRNGEETSLEQSD
jgi:uncharacterized membrane protein